MHVVLVNPYELGRQPFGLAQPAAWLTADGFTVECVDLALEPLTEEKLGRAGLVAIQLAMHTATRIAIEALPKIRALAPDAALCAYGLYAPVNASALHERGVTSLLGGECEPALLELARRTRDGQAPTAPSSRTELAKIDFLLPDRSTLPALERYSKLQMPDGGERVVGFAEASRGCKHLCRHCPVVPVYQGRFRVVPLDVVIGDIAQQVRAGAAHISFGDPDFFNGPTHALRVVRAMHEAFPALTFDATIKVEHLLKRAADLPALADAGCLFITCAVEAFDDAILGRLDKGHTGADVAASLSAVRAAGIALAPTFVAFTPWTTLAGYRDLLRHVVALELVESVPAIQLAIRLLVPAGSRLLELTDFAERVAPYDEQMLGHPWQHPDPRVDALQERIAAIAQRAEEENLGRREAFEAIWAAAHAALDEEYPALPDDLGAPVPCHSEPWYCCAEPSSQQIERLSA